MDKGIKIAIGLAAVVCLLAGVLWDSVIAPRTPTGAIADADEAATDDDGATTAKTIFEYQVVGTANPNSPPSTAGMGDIIDEMPAIGPTRRDRPVGSGDDDSDSNRPLRSDTRRAQPELAPTPTSPAADAQQQGGGGFVEHRVEDGEVLGTISEMYYNTARYWRQIMAFNGIADERAIRVGQILKIPNDPEGVRVP